MGKTLYQVNGIKMVEEAYTILAMNEVRLKALETNQSAASFFGRDSRDFCALVAANGGNTSSVLFAGLSYCNDITTISNQIYGK